MRWCIKAGWMKVSTSLKSRSRKQSLPFGYASCWIAVEIFEEGYYPPPTERDVKRVASLLACRGRAYAGRFLPKKPPEKLSGRPQFGRISPIIQMGCGIGLTGFLEQFV